MRRTLLPLVLATLAGPLHAALLGQPCARGACRVARPTIAMCSPPPLRTDAAVDVNSAASDLRKRLDSITLVESFVEATERGDAAAAMRVCTDDFLYKTHRATTDSLAAAEDRLHTKVPAPAKVTQELNEESAGIFVRASWIDTLAPRASHAPIDTAHDASITRMAMRGRFAASHGTMRFTALAFTGKLSRFSRASMIASPAQNRSF